MNNETKKTDLRLGKNGVGRDGALRQNPLRNGSFNRRGNLLQLLAAKQPVFTAVGI